MKRTALILTTLCAFSTILSAQSFGDLMPKKSKSEKELSGGGGSTTITGDHQLDLIEKFIAGSAKVHFTECENSTSFNKPLEIDKSIIINSPERDRNNKIRSIKTQIQSENIFKAVGPSDFPLYYMGEAKGKMYFLGNTAIYIKTTETITEPLHVDEKLTGNMTAAIISNDKNVVKNMNIDQLKKMLKEYLEKAAPKYKEALEKSNSDLKKKLAEAPKFIECGGVKMEITGKKISDYTNNKGEALQEFLITKKDTLYYQQVVTDDKGKMDILKSIRIPINYFHTNSQFCLVRNEELDGVPMYRVSIPVSKGVQYSYWQMMCAGNRFGKLEPEMVGSTYPLIATFHTAEEANAFLESTKKLRASLADPEVSASGSQQNKSDSKSSVRVGFYNDSGADMELFIGQSKKTIHKNENWSSTSFKVGDKVYRGIPGSSQRGSVVLTITENMDGKVYHLGSGKLK